MPSGPPDVSKEVRAELDAHVGEWLHRTESPEQRRIDKLAERVKRDAQTRAALESIGIHTILPSESELIQTALKRGWLSPRAANEHRDRLLSETNGNGFKPETAGILMSQVDVEPKADVIARGIAFRGMITLLHAGAGAGKTALAAAIASAVSTGSDFLEKPTEKGAVLWFGEDHASAVTFVSQFEGDLDNVRLLDGWELGDVDTAMVRLAQLVDHYEPSLIVFDTLQHIGSVMGIRSFSDSAEAGRLFVALHAASRHGCKPATVILHHQPRMQQQQKGPNADPEDKPKNEYLERPRDSGVFEGQSDYVVAFRRADLNKTQCALIPGKRRHAVSPEELQLDLTPDGYTVVNAIRPASVLLGMPTPDTIRKLLADSDHPLTQSELEKAHTGRRQGKIDAVKECIRIMAESRQIVAEDVVRGATKQTYTGWRLT